MKEKRRIINMVNSIIGIVVSGIGLIGVLYILAMVSGASVAANVAFISFLLIAAMLTLNIILCVKSKKNEGSDNGILIALIVIYGLSVISSLASLRYSAELSLALVLYLGLLTLCIVALVIKPRVSQQVVSQTAATVQPELSTLDAKLAELKKLYGLAIITDEQYAEAVKKIIEQAANRG